MQLRDSQCATRQQHSFFVVQRVPSLCVLEKTVLHETRVSGTVLWSPTDANSPTYTYISQKRISGNRVSDFRVSGGPPVS